MLRRSSVLIALFAVFVFAAPSNAQFAVGPEIAFHDDADFGVGAYVEFGLDQAVGGLGAMGDFLIFFPDGYDYWEANANLTYDLPIEGSSLLPFVLAGLNIANFSFDDEDVSPGIDTSSTEVGFNAGGGLKFQLGTLNPRAGIRFIFSDENAFVIFGALPFTIGGSNCPDTMA